MSLGFSAYSRTLSTLVFIEIFSGTERVAPFSLNSDQKRLELVWMFVQRAENSGNVVGSADFLQTNYLAVIYFVLKPDVHAYSILIIVEVRVPQDLQNAKRGQTF